MKNIVSGLLLKSSKVLAIVVIATVFGCGATTVVKRHCEEWAYKATDPGSQNGLAGLSNDMCKKKCDCLWTESRDSVVCELGQQSYCFTRCMGSWGLECTRWVDTQTTVDFTTRREIKK